MTTLPIGPAVKLLREQHDWSQAQLARHLGLARASEVSWFENVRWKPSLDAVAKVARAFNMSASQLIRFAERLQETIDTRHDDDPTLTENYWRAA